MIQPTIFMMIVIIAVVLLLVSLGVMMMFTSQAKDPAQGLVDFFNALLRRGY